MARSGRIIEVDALRGVAILGMLAVNVATPALREAVPHVEHAGWTGMHAADLVFPAFLVVVGCAMAAGGTPSTGRILRRVAVLFGLGLALNLLDGATLDTIRVMGVLQRIALAYGVAALIMRRGGVGTWAIGATALAALHWVLLVWPVRGATSLVPGGGVAAAVDRVVLGPAHSYLRQVPDPEGLLGTLSAATTILLGALAVTLLRQQRGAGLLAVGGLVAVAAGIGWAQLLPVSKPLWTGSYALLSAGITALVLAALVGLRPLGGEKLLGPVAALGRNALAVYVVTEAVRRLARRPFDGGESPLTDLSQAMSTLTGSAVAGGWLVVLAAVALAAGVSALLAWRGITLRA